MSMSRYEWWSARHDGTREQLLEEIRDLNEQIEEQYENKDHINDLINQAYEDMRLLNPRTEVLERQKIHDRIQSLKRNRDNCFANIKHLKEEKEFIKGRLSSR